MTKPTRPAKINYNRTFHLRILAETTDEREHDKERELQTLLDRLAAKIQNAVDDETKTTGLKVNYRRAKDPAASVLRREPPPCGGLTPSPHAIPLVPRVLAR